MYRFFLRIDMLRTLCLVSVVPVALFTLYSKLAFRLLYIFIPLTILLAIGALFLFPFKRPKDETILRDIAEVHRAYWQRVKEKNRDIREENILVAEGFTNGRLPARRIGSQRITSVCRTLVFLKRQEGWEMRVKDTSLVKKATVGPERTVAFDSDCPLVLRFLDYDEGTQSLFVSFDHEGEPIPVYLRGKFFVKELCSALEKNASVSEEMKAFLG